MHLYIYIYECIYIGELPGLLDYTIKVWLGVEHRNGRCAPPGLELFMDIDTIEQYIIYYHIIQYIIYYCII